MEANGLSTRICVARFGMPDHAVAEVAEGVLRVAAGNLYLRMRASLRDDAEAGEARITKPVLEALAKMVPRHAEWPRLSFSVDEAGGVTIVRCEALGGTQEIAYRTPQPIDRARLLAWDGATVLQAAPVEVSVPKEVLRLAFELQRRLQAGRAVFERIRNEAAEREAYRCRLVGYGEKAVLVYGMGGTV